MINVIMMHPKVTPDHVGLIPGFLDENDLRRASAQFHERYAHGGGWWPMEGFTFNPENFELKYPGDPMLHALAYIRFRDELILIYEHAFVCIVQKDGTFEVARMD